MTNINQLALRVRADGIASGWNPLELQEWVTSDYRVPAFLALIHSEICEAYAETDSDTPDAFLEAEFADILIRTLDLAGGLTTDFAFYVESATSKYDESYKRVVRNDTLPSLSDQFLALHQFVTDALEAFRADNKQRCVRALGNLYAATRGLATLLFYDIDKAIETKMAFNRTRQRRSGGKRV